MIFMENQKKIGLPMGIFVMLVVIVCAVIETLASFTGIGIIISEIINAVLAICIEAWLILMGARGFRQLATFAIGSIANGATGDYLAIIIEPLIMALTIYFVNHPNIAKVAQVTQGKIPAKAAVK